MSDPAELIAELRGFAEGSTSARASLMRDAADALELMERDRDYWRETFRELLADVATVRGKRSTRSRTYEHLSAMIYRFTGALMPGPVDRKRTRELFMERRRPTPEMAERFRAASGQLPTPREREILQERRARAAAPEPDAAPPA